MSEAVVDYAGAHYPLDESDQWDLAYAQRDRLLRIARRRCEDEYEAEDAVSEALLRAMTREFATEDHLSAWLTTVTVNLCTDAARDRSRWHRRAAYTTRHLVPVPSPEDAVVDRDTARHMVRRLEALPSRQRHALMLRAAGFGVDEVADELEVSYKTAESLLSRARAALRVGLLVLIAVLRSVFDSGRRSAAPVAATSAALAIGVLATTTPWVGGTAPGGVKAEHVQAHKVTVAAEAHRTHPRVRHATQPVGAAQQPSTSHDPHALSAANTSGGGSRRFLRPRSAGNHDLGVDSPDVDRTQPDQSLTETLRGCLRDGIVLTLSRVGCERH